ncbi:MAG: phage portal protein [Acidobacteriota bacterium]
MKPYAATFSGRMHRAVTSVVGGALGVVAPGLAERYLRGRGRLMQIRERGYQAGQLGDSNSNWRPTNKTADAEIRLDGDRMRARARDLARNDTRIKGGLATINNNVIRTGIWPAFAFKPGGRAVDKGLSTQAEDLWHLWARQADASGYGSLYQLQKLMLHHTIVDGEFLIHAVWDPKAPVLPLRFELIEADQLDGMVDGALSNGNSARRGVEFDENGRVVAYHVLQAHPGDCGMYQLRSLGKSVRVPATDMKLVFNRERITQHRGASWLASVLLQAFNLTEYDQYEMIGAKLAAAFGVFITSPYPEGAEVFGSAAKSEPLPDFIDAGIIQRLNVGEDVKIAEHSRPGNNYRDFVASNQQSIAAGMGMSYETLSKDYSRATYSSARQAILEERAGYRVLQDWFCEQVNEWILERFLLAVAMSGRLTLPNIFSNPERYLGGVAWQLPGWSWIDPLKDANGAKIRIELGLSSRTREAQAQGEDFERNIADQERELDRMIALAEKQAKLAALTSPTPQAPKALPQNTPEEPSNAAQN